MAKLTELTATGHLAYLSEASTLHNSLLLHDKTNAVTFMFEPSMHTDRVQVMVEHPLLQASTWEDRFRISKRISDFGFRKRESWKHGKKVNKGEEVKACRGTKSYFVEWSIAYGFALTIRVVVLYDPFDVFVLGPRWKCFAGCQHNCSHRRDGSGWTSCIGWPLRNRSSSRTFVWPDSHQSMEHFWHLAYRVSQCRIF